MTPRAAAHFTSAVVCFAAAAWVLVRTILGTARYLDESIEGGLL